MAPGTNQENLGMYYPVLLFISVAQARSSESSESGHGLFCRVLQTLVVLYVTRAETKT